jgi:small subunit ribosomal protein S18|nr:ribosomal protein S18 [Meringosphaera mediterranea]WLD06303.1 ribosomal protein S18 [Meringosphaera mediterranea]
MVVVKKKKQGSPIELTQDINYKDIKLIKLFITRYGRIVPRRRSSLTVKQQKSLKKAIKRARVLNLLPYRMDGRVRK